MTNLEVCNVIQWNGNVSHVYDYYPITMVTGKNRIESLNFITEEISGFKKEQNVLKNEMM